MIILFSYHLGGRGQAVSDSHPLAVRSLIEPVLLAQRYADSSGSDSRSERRSCRIAKRVAAARVETSILS
jgi:hypothetical protein